MLQQRRSTLNDLVRETSGANLQRFLDPMTQIRLGQILVLPCPLKGKALIINTHLQLLYCGFDPRPIQMRSTEVI
jgi:hypothetical protein